MSSKGRVTLKLSTDKKRKRDSADKVPEESREEKVVEEASSEVSSEDGDEEEEEDNQSEESSNDDDSDNDEDDDDEFPRRKRSKRSRHDDGSAAFSSAVSSILSSHLKAYDREDPIMARNKKVIREKESSKLEYRAKKALLAEKRKLMEKARKKDILPLSTSTSTSTSTSEGEIGKLLAKEARLRRIAQKGVVKLFNAILATQVKVTGREVTESLSDMKNKADRQELVTEVSKEKFLDLVKAAANGSE